MDNIKKLILISPETFKRYLNSFLIPSSVAEYEKDILRIIQQSNLPSIHRLKMLHQVISRNWLKNVHGINKETQTKESEFDEINEESPATNKNLEEEKRPSQEAKGTQTKYIIKKNKGTDTSYDRSFDGSLVDLTSPNKTSRSTSSDKSKNLAFNNSSLNTQNVSMSKRLHSSPKKNFGNFVRPPQITYNYSPPSPSSSAATTSGEGSLKIQKQQAKRFTGTHNSTLSELDDSDELDLSAERQEFIDNIRRETGLPNLNINDINVRGLDNLNKSYAEVVSGNNSWVSTVRKPRASLGAISKRSNINDSSYSAGEADQQTFSPTKTRAGTVRELQLFGKAWKEYEGLRIKQLKNSYIKKRRKKRKLNLNSTKN